jgi:hypothetical protein
MVVLLPVALADAGVAAEVPVVERPDVVVLVSDKAVD